MPAAPAPLTCAPVESVVFDGTKLAKIFKFTSTNACTWTVPSNLTSTTVDAYVVGGGGGGGAAGGGGGGAGAIEVFMGIPSAAGDSWTVQVGQAGAGSDLVSAHGGNGSSSTITYPGSNGSEIVSAKGGGGGGSKDQLGINSASVISGGDGINTGATQTMSFGGGSSSAGLGDVGTNHDLIAGKLYGTGGDGADGMSSGSSFIPGVFGSGGGGGAVCSQVDPLNYPGGNSQNKGVGGNCSGSSQASLDGDNAFDNTGGGGGGGARDFDFGDGVGGDGASGVIYIVQTKSPTARYLPSSCVNVSQVCTEWQDTTGTSALTATVTGAPIISETSNPPLNGSELEESIPVVQGTPSDSIVFPESVMPDNYTLFTVARYNQKENGSYQRIFEGKSDGSGINWLSGFWGAPGINSGVAFHGENGTSSNGAGWLTPVSSIHDFNWVVSTDQNNLYRSNGTTRSYGDFTGGVAPDQLTINGGDLSQQGGEASDFQVADIIVFDYELSQGEYQAVESYLIQEYGICLGLCLPPLLPPVFSTTSPLPGGEVGIAYTQTITAASPDGNAITYAVVDILNFPPGLSLDPTSGDISGTPTTAGEYTFTVEATDLVNGQSASQIFSITINGEFPPPPPEPTPVSCEDYREASFVPDNFLLDPNGYPIGCDMTGQESVTPVTTSNGSWSQRFDSQVNLDYFNLRNGWKCDDCSIGLQGEGGGPNRTGLPLGFSFNYYGKTYDSVFVNSNGSLTFGAPSDCYDETLTQIMRCGGNQGTSAIVAYGVDLDNRNLNPDAWGNPLGPDRHTEFFYWGKTTTEDGKQAFVATWMNSPGYCDSGDREDEVSELGYEYRVCDFESITTDPFSDEFLQTLSTFQIVLVDQSTSDGGVTGDADVIINYGSMQDSQNGYDSCAISRGDSVDYDESCRPTSERFLAAGLGSTQVNAENSELWNSSVTSLEALHPSIPGTILYNGVDASLVGDLGPLALSSARQFEGSIPGRFVYEFRAGNSPDVATTPSAPTASLGSATENSITVTIEPPADNGGTPVLVYSIEYRITGETNWTTASTNVQYADPSATYVLSRLTPSTNYEIRVFANNGIGNSEPTESISLSTSVAPGAPETPSFSSPVPFVVDPFGQIEYKIELLSPLPDSISVRYRPTAQGTSAALPWVTETLASNSIGGSTGILNPDTQYEFQISAQNSFGSSAWSESALVTSSPVDDRYLDAGGVSWMGYGSQISAALEGNGGDGLVYDGALKVFVGTGSRSTAIQIECDQSSISYPGFDVGVEGKQGHYEWETAETRVQGGYTVTCAPVPVTLSGQEVLVSLSRFFFTDSPWTRVMIDITNLDQSEVSVGVWLESELQSEINAGDTSYEASSSSNNPASPATGDRWVVTGDSKQSGMVVAHVFGQPLDDPNISDGVNQDGSDLMLSEFWMSVPGTNSNKQNSSRLAWFDGIVQYDVASDPSELDENYAGAVATAKAAAESFTKVKSQLTDTYPRFVPPTLTNFRMPAQLKVSPGVFNSLKIARISGLDKNVVNYQLNLAARYGMGDEIPTTFKITSDAQGCIDNTFNSGLFPDNTEVSNVDLTIVGSQQELNCFLEGLSFTIPEPPISSLYGSLVALLSKNVDGHAAPLSFQSTELFFEGNAVDQTSVDVEAGNATWRGVGTGIKDVETRSNRNAFDRGSLKVYWIPNVNADPLVDGLEIICPQDAITQLTEDAKVKQLFCTADEVVTPSGTLSIGISRNFATSDPWQQMELNIINNGTGEIGGALAYRLDLGSDENTQIEMTSDGDLNLESADSWFITSDDGQRTDPVLLHYVGHETGQKITRGTDANIDKIWVKTPLVVAGGTQVMKRYLEGVVDAPRGQIADSVIVAMKAADAVANGKYRVPSESGGYENLNIADIALSTAVTFDRNLPTLHTVYECRDFGRNALGPITLQQDGKVIGCNAFDEAENNGPGGVPGSDSINDGLFPGNQNLDQSELADSWSETFRATFPNAQPRLGWACDSCIVTREGVVSSVEDELPAGLPLGFTTSVYGGTGNYDSVRILPQGVVQLHDSTDTDPLAHHIISAFGNAAMSNGVLQGNWNELPDYDFFYWGRTIYQGRVAFVITWVKIPTVEYSTSVTTGAQIGDPIADLDPTSVQLMLVSDSTFEEFGEYMEATPETRAHSDLDIIWNFDSIQAVGAQNLLTTGAGNLNTEESTAQPLYSGTFTFNDSYSSLISDESIETEELAQIGVVRDNCNATCVATELLSNKFQSPVIGRYVMGYRDYVIAAGPQGGIPGFIAPAAPRFVQVIRQQADVAEISWKAPKPWVIAQLNSVGGTLAGASPIFGYRIEYAENDRGESWNPKVYPALNELPLQASDLVSSDDGGETRYSIAIDDLPEGEQYTFRVYATYAGLDLPDPATDLMFETEIRSVPSLANEQHVSELDISPVGLLGNPMALGAQAIAGQLAGDLEISNATINGSSYAYGVTANSVATFTGGADSIGFNQGLVISPLVDARTFERGSGITEIDSVSEELDLFTEPQERSKYEEIYAEFDAFMQTQQSWVPGDPGQYEPVCDISMGPPGPSDSTDLCVNGMTVLQFDVMPSADFLKFEYALAGTETGGEIYGYPDGFGLFVGGIDQSHSCALVPQVNETSPEERFLTTANALESRIASYVPFDSDLHAATVTSPITCSANVSDNFDSQTPVTVTMVIANANDAVLSPAVFLEGNSIRFDATSIAARDIPEARLRTAYSAIQFDAAGTPPATWSAVGLPAGMSLTAGGELWGTPTESGNFNFTVKALGEAGSELASQAFSILVVDVPDELSCKNLNTESSLLDVLVLSKFEGSPTSYRIGTDVTGLDRNIADILCRSEYLTTTFYDGANGTSTAWGEMLDSQDVLVIPSTSDDLVGSSLMSVQALETIKSWMQDGGRVILTDGANHIPELAELIDVDKEHLEISIESGSSVLRTGSAAQALPTSLPVSEEDNSSKMLTLDSAAAQEFYDASPDRYLTDLYTSWTSDGNDYLRKSVASSFVIDQGEVSFLSSNFGINRTVAWDKVLLQSIYGTAGASWTVFEAGISWSVYREGAHWTESNSASRFEIGYGYSKNVANCLNTPSRPSVRIVSELGTRIKCSSYLLQDGLVDGGVTLQVERFFSSASPWMKSSINLVNNDSDNPYETSLVVGGSQAQENELDIEATSYFPDGTTDLGELIEGVGFAPHTWTVASSGSALSIVKNDWNYPVVTQVFGTAGWRTQGGIGRDSWEGLGDDDIKGTYDLEIDPLGSKSFSYFTGVVPFAAGCDRTAVAVAKQGAIDLQKSFLPNVHGSGLDGWPFNSSLDFPSLSTTGCSAFEGVPTGGVAANSSFGTGVDLTWNNVPGATSYEVYYRSNGNWSPGISVNGSADSKITTTIYGLARATDYEFAIRAKRSNFGSHGDTSLGDPASELIQIRTAAEAPKPIVRKAQVSPTVPKAMKVKKTVKFTMKTKAGLELAVTSKGACKTTKITVKKTVGKKKTTTQTGWLVTATKKGNCTVTLKAKGNTKWLPLSITRIVKVS